MVRPRLGWLVLQECKMVRPVNSKRKLFNSNKEHFKENEPSRFVKQVSNNHPLNHSKGTSSHLQSAGFCKDNLSLSSGESVVEIVNDKIGILSNSKICDVDDGAHIHTPGRIAMPMSERQQIALLLQMSSPTPTNNTDLHINNSSTPNTPHCGRGSSKRNERGETPLHVASIKGDIDKVSQIISQGANVNAADYAGWTALHEACNRGYTTIAHLLIKAGADVNAKGLDNDTPLHDACVNNHYTIVKLLLKSGAKTDFINRRGKSPRDICRSPKILSLIEQIDSGGILDDFESGEIENSYIAGIQKEKFYFSRELKSPADFEFSNSYLKADMSRRTPPNNKLEEKPINTALNTLAASQVGNGNNANTTGSSSNGNGRPGSPRVTLRLPPVQRTPDKSQQRSLDSKEMVENEDVYEFRCGKDEPKGEEREERSDLVKQENLSSENKCDKRLREDGEDEEEVKKKRKKDDTKEGAKVMGRGNPNRTNASEKCTKVGSRNNGGSGISSKVTSSASIVNNTVQPSSLSSASVTSSGNSGVSTCITNAGVDARKSPMGSAANSPKPATNSPTNGKNSDKGGDSDSEDLKNEAISGAPKVPPLKIVLAPCGGSEQETSSQNGKNGNNRQLPYVVNSSSGNSDDKDVPASESKDSTVVIKEEPHDVSVSTTSSTSSSNITSTNNNGNNSSNNTSGLITTCVSSSVVSSVAASSSSTSQSSVSSSVTSTTNTSEKLGGTRITRSQRGGGSEESAPVKIEPKLEEPSSSSGTSEAVHPRKRKLKLKEPEIEQPSTSLTPEQPITNCYDMFLKIRKQVERRRKLLFPVQPKPPSGFKDYLMNRCSYVLANNSNSHLSVPIIPPPPSLSQSMKDLFTEQEQERHKLKLQQLVEKEKLVLSVEQEILRVHGRAARALANQVLPFSVCTILKDEEVYNIISAEQEEKDRTARSRYNGRLFLSWLQDVDDKWEKIKEAMVLRHHNEAESLHAVQKMDWEWKQKELGLVEPSMKALIDEMHVPMVQVADFDLLPA